MKMNFLRRLVLLCTLYLQHHLTLRKESIDDRSFSSKFTEEGLIR